MLLQGSVTVLSGVAVNDVVKSVEDFTSPEKKTTTKLINAVQTFVHVLVFCYVFSEYVCSIHYNRILQRMFLFQIAHALFLTFLDFR